MQEDFKEDNYDFIDFEYFIELEMYNKRYQLKCDNKQKSLENYQSQSQILFKRNNDIKKIQKFFQRTKTNEFSDKEICELVLKELDELDLTKNLAQFADIVMTLVIEMKDIPFVVEVYNNQYVARFVVECIRYIKNLLKNCKFKYISN